MLKNCTYLFLVVFLFFSPCLNANFIILDDPKHVVANPALQHLSLNSLSEIFSQTVNETYIPLTTLSFAIERYFFGLNPIAYHFNNLLLHAIVVILVYFLALRMGLSGWAAFFAALIFGIHPMKVESVAWVTERKDVLYAFFYLLAMHQYWSYLKLRSRKAYCWSVLFGLLSILAKPMAVSLPLILLLMDWFNGSLNAKNKLLEKLPFLLIALFFGWATFISNIGAHHPEINVGQAISHPIQSILIWVWCFMFYIWKFIFPFNVQVFYALPTPINILHWPYLLALIGFILMLVYLLKYKENRLLQFAFFYYVLSIFFIFRLNNGDFSIVSDRYMYLPCLGLCFFIGNVFEKLFRWKIIGVGLCIFLVCLGIKSYLQSQVWYDTMTYTTEMIKYYPRSNVDAYLMRGREYYTRQKPDLALADFSQAISNNPQSLTGYFCRGIIYFSLEENKKALNDFNKILELDPNNALALKWKSAVIKRTIKASGSMDKSI